MADDAELEYGHRERFGDVDATGEAPMFIQFLDRVALSPPARARRRKTFELLGVRPGDVVLDAGCGTGIDTLELVELILPQGRAVGIDVSEAMIAEARRRTEDRRLPVEFHVADATELPFLDGSFTVYRAERLYQHLDDPDRGIAEAVRVLEPRGRIAIVEQDWETLVFAGGDERVTRAILNCWCDRIGHGWIGRELLGRMRAVGLEDVAVVPDTLASDDHGFFEQIMLRPLAKEAAEVGAVTQEEAQRWLADLGRANEDGRFFASMTLFIVHGVRP